MTYIDNKFKINVIRDFIIGFQIIHKLETEMACATIVSAFISCYWMLSNEDRSKAADHLFKMIEEINITRFEDRRDFVSYLKENITKLGESND